MSADIGILREKIARLTDERDRLLTELAETHPVAEQERENFAAAFRGRVPADLKLQQDCHHPKRKFLPSTSLWQCLRCHKVMDR